MLIILLVVVVYALSSDKKGQKAQSTDSVKVFSYNCEKEKSTFEVLVNKFDIKTTDSSYGKMVTGIDGIVPDKNEYWAFYIDGKTSSVGAENYKCMGEEKIEWRLDKF